MTAVDLAGLANVLRRLESPGAGGAAIVLVLGALPVVLGPMVSAGVTRVDERMGGTERAR